MNKKPMSLIDFKDWLSSQKDISHFFNLGLENSIDEKNDTYIGKPCKSKVCAQKLNEKIETDQDSEELINEFLEKGGTVVSIDGKLVEIETGFFYLPKYYIKIKK
jgi:hypothetical protein